MKRFLALMVCFCLWVASCSFAEEKEPDLLESIGNWFGQAWEDSTAWVSQAWTDSTTWVNNAWGDASKWVGQAWNDSSKWVSDIWGDASTWATDTFNSATGAVGSWWEETFNKTVAIDEAWLMNDNVGQAFSNLRKYLFEPKVTMEANGNSASEITIHDFFAHLLSKLKLNDDDITEQDKMMRI